MTTTTHQPAPGTDLDPYDTCAGCGKPVRYRPETGQWVTMIGASAECWPAATGRDAR